MTELNIKSTTLEKGLDLAKEFIGKLLGPAISEQGEIWGDSVRLRRMKNQIDGLEDVRRTCEQKNIPLRQLNLKVLFPYLEGIAVEEDKTLRDMWANLLVNYIDTSKNLISHVYPSILQQLSSDEVQILKRMEENHYSINVVRKKNRDAFCPVELLVNLERLGIVRPIPLFRGEKPPINEKRAVYKSETAVQVSQIPANRYHVTQFGKQFLEACKR